MAPFEKDILDYTLLSSVRLERFSESLRLRIIALLKQAEKSIYDEIIKIDPTATQSTNWKKARMARLSKQIDNILTEKYTEIKDDVDTKLKELSVLEATYFAKALNNIMGVDLFQVTLTPEFLQSIVDNTLIQGGPIKDWFNTQAQNAKQRLSRTLAEAVHKSNVLQIGQVKGESVQELTTAVKGVAVDGKFGVLNMSRREAEALVRTSVLQVANQARMAMFMKNTDLLKGWQLVAVLDDRTTEFCRAADGGQYDINWSPIEGTRIAVDGPPPYHWQCFIDGKTPIYTSEGWKAISKIKVGDLVLTHKGRFRKVTELLFSEASVESNSSLVYEAWLNGENDIEKLHSLTDGKLSRNSIYGYLSSWNKGTPPPKHILNEKFKKDIVEIELDIVRQNCLWSKITVTEDHPILVNGNWINAGDIKKGDKIYFLANKCGHCGNLIPHYMKYCSFSCASIENTKTFYSSERGKLEKKKKSIRTKKQLEREYLDGTRDRYLTTKAANEVTRKMAEEGTHPFQNPDIRGKGFLRHTPEIDKKHSERMKTKNPMWMEGVKEKSIETRNKFFLEHPERHPNRIMAEKGFISSLERKMMEILDELQIDYKHQFPIDRFFADFAIEDLKIVIECDGEHWHKDTEKDNERQRLIESLGWTVLRFSEKRIKKDSLGIKEELLRVFCNHVDGYDFMELEVKSVRRYKLKKSRKLYNFSVEEDESYVAKGVVVHNCRTTFVPILKDFKDLLEEAQEGKSDLSKRIAAKLDKKLAEIETRASMNGPVPADLTYNSWLKTQSEETQIEILGKAKQKIWKEKGLSLSNLINQKGRPLTIKQLKQLYKA